jgi:hypothetical protein
MSLQCGVEEQQDGALAGAGLVFVNERLVSILTVLQEELEDPAAGPRTDSDWGYAMASSMVFLREALQGAAGALLEPGCSGELATSLMRQSLKVGARNFLVGCSCDPMRQSMLGNHLCALRRAAAPFGQRRRWHGCPGIPRCLAGIGSDAGIAFDAWEFESNQLFNGSRSRCFSGRIGTSIV